MEDKIDFILGEKLPNLRNMQHSCVFVYATDSKNNGNSIVVTLTCGHKRRFSVWELEGQSVFKTRFECEECPTPPEAKEKMNALFRLLGMEEWK